MNTRKLGNSDLHLTEVGLGAWAIGGDWEWGWGQQDDTESINTIHRALDLGINWIDTAAIYGHGHSEEVVGKAVAGKRNDVIIATKCTMVWDEKHNITFSLQRDSVRRECEASLRRLDTDYIDLYQIHWPNDDERIEEGWEEIGRLKEEGKIRWAGVSNFMINHLDRAHGIHHVTSLQPPYSMIRRDIEADHLKWCADHECGIICYSPMQAGLLTGKFDKSRLQPTDWRHKSPEFQEPNLSVNLEFVEAIRPIAEKYNKTVAQLAIAWVLRNPEVTAAIVGARKPSQIEETVGGADWKIEQEDINKIEDLLRQRAEKLG